MKHLYLFSLVFVMMFHTAEGQQKKEPITKQYCFVFHNGFWVNLHHDLYQKALQLKSGKFVADSTNHTNDYNDWIAAIKFYKQNLVSRPMLFDMRMVAIKNALEDQENNNSLITNNDSLKQYFEIINHAAAYYKNHLWLNQYRINQKWINTVEPLIEKYGDSITLELLKIYQTPWPKEAIRIDVTNYATWSGAYTTLDPTRITVASADSSNQKLTSLEVVFHEASHAMIDKVLADIEQQCKISNVTLPRTDLWHAVLFYTVGEVVKRHIPHYTPYAYAVGLWNRAWPMYINVLDKDWKPYIDGKVSYTEAITNLVNDLGKKN